MGQSGSGFKSPQYFFKHCIKYLASLDAPDRAFLAEPTQHLLQLWSSMRGTSSPCVCWICRGCDLNTKHTNAWNAPRCQIRFVPVFSGSRHLLHLLPRCSDGLGRKESRPILPLLEYFLITVLGCFAFFQRCTCWKPKLMTSLRLLQTTTNYFYQSLSPFEGFGPVKTTTYDVFFSKYEWAVRTHE